MAEKSSSWDELGVYTPRAAADLLGIRPTMVRRWLYGDRSGASALVPQYPPHRGEHVTFVDLVQLMAIRDIRRQRRLSLQKIRQTVRNAKRLGIDYPFARRHTTYVFQDDVVLRVDGDRLIQVTGHYREQDLMEPVVESYMRDLGFDSCGLAFQYEPVKSRFRSVVLNPSLNFGAPTVQPSGYTVATLLSSLRAEGSVEAAADICNVNVNDIRIASEFEESLQQAA